MYLDSFSGDSGKNNVLCLRKTFKEADGSYREEQIPIISILQNLDHEASLRAGSLTERDLRTALMLATMRLPETDEYKRNNRYKRTKILLDENLSTRLIPELSRELSNLSHIYFEGMQGATDEFIYWRPWTQLKNRTAREQRVHAGTKYIIITLDSDLTEIARNQWLKRIVTSSTPEDIDFSNVNAIFHVRDINLGRPENGTGDWPVAKDILRAAYSGEASSYSITKNGVRPEAGCSKKELIAYADRIAMFERFKTSELTIEDENYLAACQKVKIDRRTRQPGQALAMA